MSLQRGWPSAHGNGTKNASATDELGDLGYTEPSLKLHYLWGTGVTGLLQCFCPSQLQCGDRNPLSDLFIFPRSRLQGFHADALHLYLAIPHHGLSRPMPSPGPRRFSFPAVPRARPRSSPHRACTAAAGASSLPGRGRQILPPSPPSWKWARTPTAATCRVASRRQGRGRVYLLGLGAAPRLPARDRRREAGVCEAGIQGRRKVSSFWAARAPDRA